MPTLAEQFTSRHPTTQVGRALEAARIVWIAARSPQAKGRVERVCGSTLQDRLCSGLRLAGAATIEEANAVVAQYLPRRNARFAGLPRDATSAWRPLERTAEALCCFRQQRLLAADGALTGEGRSLMLAHPAGVHAVGGP